jgi:hypothetical protein
VTDRPRNPDKRSDRVEDEYAAASPERQVSVQPVPVEVLNPVSTTTGSTKYGVYSTFTIPASPAGSTSVMKVMPLDPLRQYGYITAVDGPVILAGQSETASAPGNIAASFSAASISAGGGAVAPAGAGTVIATWTVTQAGEYAVAVAMTIASGVAADHNNMGLYVNGTLNSLLPVGTNTAPTVSDPVMLNLAVGAVVTVQQIATTTATDYYAVINATPEGSMSPPTSVSGYYLSTGTTTPPIRHNEAVYVANPSATSAVHVSVAVERGDFAG